MINEYIHVTRDNDGLNFYGSFGKFDGPMSPLYPL